MKTLSRRILILGTLTIVFGLLPVLSAKAVDSLIVHFESTPLFNETNFNPGTTVAKWVEVINNSGSTQNIAVEAINHPNPVPVTDLSRALNIVIKQGLTDLYGGSTGAKTLYDFYEAGEVYLSSVNHGQLVQYDFVITFPQEATDEWQARTTGFDILIGFQGTEGQGSGGGQSSGGSGGFIYPAGLVIVNESVYVTQVNEFSVTIEWDTSHFSTSQVIYGAEGEAHTLNMSDATSTPPTYGYAHTTPEYDTAPKVTHHKVVITGLNPGTTYYYRAVSHGSLAISREYTFATSQTGVGGAGEFEGNVSGPTGTGQTGQEGIVLGETSEQAGAGIQPEEEQGTTTQETEIATSTSNPTFAAALINILDFIGDRAWLIIILIIVFAGIVYFIIWLIIKRRRKDKQKPQQPIISV